MADLPIAVGVAGRPHPAETVSGDACAIHWSDGACRIAVIDGLGHGVDAAAAAARAVAVLDADPALDPAESLRRCHAALAGSRGAAISIARLDARQGELTYAGVGNVEAHLWQNGRRERPIAYRGIVGTAIPRIRTFTTGLAGDWVFLLHSDGISARAELTALSLAPPWDPEALAQAFLARYARTHDDAIAVVAIPTR